MVKLRKDFFLTDNIFSFLLNPFHTTRRELFYSLKKYSQHVEGKVLDVGCGTKPYKELFYKCTEYIGLEYGETRTELNSYADLFYNGDIFPIESSSFDTVVTFQVLEHVSNSKQFLNEVHRILKTNGTLLLTVPLCWPEHEQPYDFKRFTRFGLRKEVEEAGFEVQTLAQLGNEEKVILQLVANYFSNLEQKIPTRFFQRIFRLVYCPAISIIGLIFRNQDSALYFDNLVVAKKI